MTLHEKIQAGVTAAMKARDNERRDALRLILSAIKYAEIDAPGKQLTPEMEIELLSREAKKRRESIESFEAAGHPERAKAEEFELHVIQEFLPQPLTADEVREIVKNIIDKNHVENKKDIGIIMKELQPQIKGKFPGKDAKAIVDSFFA